MAALGSLVRLFVAGGAGYSSVKAGVWNDGSEVEVPYLKSKKQLEDQFDLKLPEVKQYMSSVLSKTHESQTLSSVRHSFYQGWNRCVSASFLFLSGQSSQGKFDSISKKTVLKVKEWINAK